jgi:ATP adenylyltransferase
VEQIRSPWRHGYVTKVDQHKGCVLCEAYAGRQEPTSLVVHTAALNFVVMNLYPYTSGHLMIAPLRHVARLQDATPEELGEMMGLARRFEGILQEVYRPDGLNVGMNLGRPAGAGVADHIHLHVVPRWSGDTNFMTVVGETRVIPEDPLQACATLRRHFEPGR